MKAPNPPIRPGDRVGVVVDLNREAVRFAGYGVFQGEFPVGEKAVGFFAESIRSEGRPNPRILLDSGERVWGCECWWGREEDVRGNLADWTIGGKRILQVSITEERRRYRGDRRAKQGAQMPDVRQINP